ncbi:NOA1 [Symbiodinium natans]|uniref:NOA1 protein n=1 Tax=Symbiodinium natans TaxID=878477 RepID=A0A812QUJ2_9DINO|nr:NOA1 [Symbiodinium natans]
MVEEIVPNPRRSQPGVFDPHTDDPLTKGIDLMTRANKASERLICCRGCGIPLQTHDPNNVGYVRFSNYLEKWSERLHRKLLCSRCLALEQGQLVPVVKEVMAEGQVGFGGQVVPADVLAQQLQTISKRRCLVVYIVDVLDFNGSFIRKIRQIVGKNPVVLIGTKIDLLPPKTKLEPVEKWLLYILRKKKLRVVNVKLVSNETGKYINHAANAIIESRCGMDVFVVGAANAGKSCFITRLLDRLEEKFPQGKVEDCPRPLVSRTPGTTLGTIQLRAFRRSATSPVFASLYDTPGVHQPSSMQNLLDIEAYNYVQPTRKFGVHTVCPGKDVLEQLKASGEDVTPENLKQWLDRPVRYLWGFPGQPPVVAVEVYPPVSAQLQLSFVGVHNLVVSCVANVPKGGEDGRGYPDPPDGLALASLCYVKTPDSLSMDGHVMSDISLTGFGWVAVSFAALNGKAAGRPMQRSKVTIRVYGPKRLKVVQNEFPMPVAGLPGFVPAPPEVGLDDEDPDEVSSAEEVDSIDPEKPIQEAEVPSQPWAADLGNSVGGFMRRAPGGGATGADKDDEAAAEAVTKPEAAPSSTLRRRPKLIDSTRELDRELDRLGLDMPPEEAEALRSATSQFEVPVHDLDDGYLPLDDFDEEAAYSGPMPEFAPAASDEPFEGDPFGDDWSDAVDMSRFPEPKGPAVDAVMREEEPSAPPRQRGKKHRWYGMTREEIKETKAREKSERRRAKQAGSERPAADQVFKRQEWWRAGKGRSQAEGASRELRGILDVTG